MVVTLFLKIKYTNTLLKMKKTIFVVCLLIMSLGAKSFSEPLNKNKENPSISAKTENKLSDEELNRIAKRVDEIRNMDKSKLTVKERRVLRKELKADRVKLVNGGYIYVGAGTLIVIILLLILLL